MCGQCDLGDFDSRHYSGAFSETGVRGAVRSVRFGRRSWIPRVVSLLLGGHDDGSFEISASVPRGSKRPRGKEGS